MGRIIRVYLPPAQVGDEVAVGREDVHHLAQVLRLSGGTVIEGFDGEGGWYRGVFSPGGPTGGRFRVTETRRENIPAAGGISLGLALIRPEPMEWAIQKATELGCRQFIPLVSHHVDRRDAAAYIRGRLPRWERIVRESMKQCRRNTLMTLSPPLTAADFFRRPGSGRRLLLHPQAEKSHGTWWRRADADSSCLVAIGPEGGWSEAEVDLARSQGFECFGLGDIILRAETAALAILAVLQLAGE